MDFENSVYFKLGKLDKAEQDRFMEVLDWYEAETPFSIPCYSVSFENDEVIFYFEKGLLPKHINELSSFMRFYDKHC